MSPASIAAVSENVPKARPIYDRFHDQRLVQNALDETRRDQVRVAKDKEEQKALKGTRWALPKSEWSHTDPDDRTLAQLEHASPAIFRGHMLKEWFTRILDGHRINFARRRLEEWVDEAKASVLDAYAKAAATIKRHRDGILDYVRTRSSDGRTRGGNGKIQTITRRSFGFHSARALISMIFLRSGGIRVTPAFSTPRSFYSRCRRAVEPQSCAAPACGAATTRCATPYGGSASVGLCAQLPAGR